MYKLIVFIKKCFKLCHRSHNRKICVIILYVLNKFIKNNKIFLGENKYEL